MNSGAHRISGVLVALGGLAIAGPTPHVLAWGVGCMAGARAPDWMEAPYWRGGKRFSLIPHRTVTHWVGAWAVAAVALGAMTYYQPSALHMALMGFVTGALAHCAMDATTPMGVPFLNPFSRKRI